MKKFLKTAILAAVFTVLPALSVYADAVIDTSKATNGIVSVKYTGSSNDVRIKVDLGANSYNYALIGKNPNSVPLQMGSGKYVITVFEGAGGNKYRPIKSETIEVKSIDESAMFTASSILIDYAASTQAIPSYKTKAGAQSGQEKVDTIYTDIIENYKYDFEKAATVPNDYVPVIDQMYSGKKGICFDYAAIFTGVLRSQGVPSKLIMGYAPDLTEYHAWSEIYLGGKWVVVDTTMDAALQQAGRETTFAKDGSKYRIVKVY